MPEGVYLQELQCLYNVFLIIYLCSLKSIGILSFVLIDCWVSELYVHLYPFCNVWPEAVYCCFT